MRGRLLACALALLVSGCGADRVIEDATHPCFLGGDQLLVVRTTAAGKAKALETHAQGPEAAALADTWATSLERVSALSLRRDRREVLISGTGGGELRSLEGELVASPGPRSGQPYDLSLARGVVLSPASGERFLDLFSLEGERLAQAPWPRELVPPPESFGTAMRRIGHATLGKTLTEFVRGVGRAAQGDPMQPHESRDLPERQQPPKTQRARFLSERLVAWSYQVPRGRAGVFVARLPRFPERRDASYRPRRVSAFAELGEGSSFAVRQGRVFVLHGRQVRCYSIASLHEEEAELLWETQLWGGELLFPNEIPTWIESSPQAKTLLVGSPARVAILDAGSGELVRKELLLERNLTRFACGEGAFAAYDAWTGEALIWRTKGREALCLEVAEELDPLRAFALSESGEWLALQRREGRRVELYRVP